MATEAIKPLLPSSSGRDTRTILHPSSGLLKPGEMCLVLGCPGSGCTTFLRTITNQREGYANVGGKVLYAGMNADEMAKFYKGEVVYNEEGEFDSALTLVRGELIKIRLMCFL
jgi:ATP-binding cassette, subfamily G (WHITE), member 2, SNQ2